MSNILEFKHKSAQNDPTPDTEADYQAPLMEVDHESIIDLTVANVIDNIANAMISVNHEVFSYETNELRVSVLAELIKSTMLGAIYQNNRMQKVIDEIVELVEFHEGDE